MYREKDILRLINCLEGAFILHAGVLLLSPFWHPPGILASSFQPIRYAPLTVRLVAQQRPSAILPVKEQTERARDFMSPPDVSNPGVHVASPKKLPTPVYLAARELTRQPEMTGTPPEAMEIGQQVSGEVVFKLSISHQGIVTRLERVKSTLPHDIEGELALQLYRNEYRAGEIDGVAVDSEMIVDLRLESGGWLSDQLPVLRQGKSQDPP